MSSRLSFHNNVQPAPEESNTYSRSQSRRRDQSRDTSVSGVSSASNSVSQPDRVKRSRRQRVKDAFAALFSSGRNDSDDKMAGKIERIRTAEKEREARWRSIERSRTPQRDHYVGL